jgi:hypothetical protein
VGLGQDATGKDYRFAQMGAGALGLLPLGFGHALVGRVRVDLSLGEAPAQNLYRLGGRYRGGRGFEIDEARATRRGVVSGEYRHVLHGGGRTDFFGALMLTRLDGAFFADAVYLPVARAGCHREVFYDVGYGIRFMADILNVAPGSLALDVGLPIGRCEDERGRVPVTIYMAFVQSFLSF